MKHEHFKIFRVKQNSPISGRANAALSEELAQFLNSGIYPKSISVDNYYNGEKLVLIGYRKPSANENPSEYKYHIVIKVIKDLKFIGLKNVGDEIEKVAKEVGGVICQDIEYLEETITITFLTTK